MIVFGRLSPDILYAVIKTAGGSGEDMTDYNTRLLYLMKFFGALTMRIRIRLKQPVDGEILEAAINKTMKRYPYLAKKIGVRDGAFVLEENDLPVKVIKNSEAKPAFGSKELNYHLLCADYEGNDLYITLLHNLGGGRGLYRFCFSVLYQYIYELTGEYPAGDDVRLAKDPVIPGEELIQPLSSLPEIEPLWQGFPPEVRPCAPSRLEELLKEDKTEGAYLSTYYLDEKEVMECVKKRNASPSIWFAVLYYKALLRCVDEVPEYLDLGLACDVSDQYGFSESMSLITRFLHFVISQSESTLDKTELCMKGKAMIKEQRDAGVTNEILKKERDTLERMDELPSLSEKAKYYLEHSLIADMTPSTLVSYVGRYDLSGAEQYAEDVTVAGINFTNGIVLTAMNGCFMPQIAHRYEDAAILDAFEAELAAEGIKILRMERNNKQDNYGVILPDEI